jgi:hypothetical protein
MAVGVAVILAAQHDRPGPNEPPGASGTDLGSGVKPETPEGRVREFDLRSVRWTYFLHKQSAMVEELRPNGRRRIGFDVEPALRGSLFVLPSHRGVVVGSCAVLRHQLAKWSILDARLFQVDD